MLENLFNLVKQQAGDAIIHNPAISNQHNKEAVKEAGVMKRILVSLMLLSISHLVQAQLPKMGSVANAGNWLPSW